MTLFRLGQAYVKATSKEEAVKIAQTLNEDEIRWLAEKEGMPGKYLVTLAEVQ
jgi:hypothetical protein